MNEISIFIAQHMYISVETISWCAIEMRWMNENKNGFYFWVANKMLIRLSLAYAALRSDSWFPFLWMLTASAMRKCSVALFCDSKSILSTHNKIGRTVNSLNESERSLYSEAIGSLAHIQWVDISAYSYRGQFTSTMRLWELSILTADMHAWNYIILTKVLKIK